MQISKSLHSSHIYSRLQNITLGAFFLLALYIVLKGAAPLSTIGAILVLISTVFPVLLWISHPRRGLPIFPLFTIPFIWGYATPLVIGHETVETFTDWEHIVAAISVSGFLIVATIAWWITLQKETEVPTYFYSFDKERYTPLLFTMLSVGLFYQLATHQNWLSFGHSYQVILTVAIEVSVSLAGFILGYMWGAKRLSGGQKLFMLLLVIPTCYIQSLSFVLMAPVAKLVIITAAVFIGGRKIPYLFAFIILPMFVVLHFGKYEMRGKYWTADRKNVPLFEIPSTLNEWYGHSFSYLFDTNERIDLLVPEEQTQQSRHFLDRLSLMHMFLEVQKHAGQEVPYLSGKTYKVLYKAILPRFINPGKVSSHESNHLLTVGYGKQTRGQTLSTHIAWGLVAEAWANFGALGLIIIGIIVGTFCGLAQIYSRGLSLLSFRGCFGALICVSAIHANATTLAIVSISIFHSFIVLLLLAYLFMSSKTREG